MWDMIKTRFHFPSDSQFLWKTILISSQTGFLPMYRSLFGGTLSTAHVTWRLRQNRSVRRNELWYILHQLHNTIYITFFKATLYIQTTSCHQISCLMIRTFKLFFHFLAGGRRGRYGKYRNVKNVMSTLQLCSACRTARIWIPHRRIAVSLFRH